MLGKVIAAGWLICLALTLAGYAIRQLWIDEDLRMAMGILFGFVFVVFFTFACIEQLVNGSWFRK